MSKPIILHGARVVDPGNNIDEIRDLGIADGVFVRPDTLHNAIVHDLKGKIVAPGFIDMHVHLRDPGQTHRKISAAAPTPLPPGDLLPW